MVRRCWANVWRKTMWVLLPYDTDWGSEQGMVNQDERS